MMMGTTNFSPELLGFIKAIGSESRMKILLLFLDGQERTVNQVAQAVGLGQPTTSEHLAIMKRSGVLVCTKDGKEVYYRPDRGQINWFLETLSTLLKDCCKV
jgi:ArsR family transcriptional regulator, arsenate/arsenite/antimonite-responsive transcriptional repressor